MTNIPATNIANLSIFFITRFNISAPFTKVTSDGKPINLDQDWLSERKKLFFRFCLPSIEKQKSQEFKWFILFDPATDPEYVKSICRDPRSEAITSTNMRDGLEKIRKRISELCPENGISFVASVRFDSDDALSPTYTEELRNQFKNILSSGETSREFLITFSQGQQYITEDNTYRLYEYPHNAFCALIEKIEQRKKAITVYCSRNGTVIAHSKLLTTYKSIVIDDVSPQWCMVIHGNNVLNDARGVPLATPAFVIN